MAIFQMIKKTLFILFFFILPVYSGVHKTTTLKGKVYPKCADYVGWSTHYCFVQYDPYCTSHGHAYRNKCLLCKALAMKLVDLRVHEVKRCEGDWRATLKF